MRTSTTALALVALLALGTDALAKPLEVDPAHTGVGFKIRHLFSQVSGRFDEFDGTIEFDPEAPEKTVIDGSIDAASIDTDNEKRDTHLRNADFFDVEKFHKITFKSTGVSDIDHSKKTAKVKGDLTLHGVTKPIVLEAAYLGTGKDPWGNDRSGFHAETTISRKEFGMEWNKVLDAGSVMLGDEVKIEIDVEAMPEK